MRISEAKQTGDASELLVAYWLTRAGITVCWPFGDRGQYDLVGMFDGLPLRVQVKTGKRDHPDSLTWRCISHGSKAHHSYIGLADLFAVTDLESGKAYLVPVCICGASRATLKLEGEDVGKTIGLARDFEIVEGEGYAIKVRLLFENHAASHTG